MVISPLTIENELAAGGVAEKIGSIKLETGFILPLLKIYHLATLPPPSLRSQGHYARRIELRIAQKIVLFYVLLVYALTEVVRGAVEIYHVLFNRWIRCQLPLIALKNSRVN